MRQLLAFQDIIGKTIQATHSFCGSDYEDIVLQFSDETFVVLRAGGGGKIARIELLRTPHSEISKVVEVISHWTESPKGIEFYKTSSWCK